MKWNGEKNDLQYMIFIVVTITMSSDKKMMTAWDNIVIDYILLLYSHWHILHIHIKDNNCYFKLFKKSLVISLLSSDIYN